MWDLYWVLAIAFASGSNNIEIITTHVGMWFSV